MRTDARVCQQRETGREQPKCSWRAVGRPTRCCTGRCQELLDRPTGCLGGGRRCASAAACDAVYSVRRMFESMRNEFATECEGRAVGARLRSLRLEVGWTQTDL